MSRRGSNIEGCCLFSAIEIVATLMYAVAMLGFILIVAYYLMYGFTLSFFEELEDGIYKISAKEFYLLLSIFWGIIVVMSVAYSIFLFRFRKKGSKFNELEQNIKKEYEDLTKNLQNKYALIEQELKSKEKKLLDRKVLFEMCRKLDHGIFNKISSLVADYETSDYLVAENYNRTKPHPAFKRALDISDLRIKTRQAKLNEKVATYKLEALLAIFPELNKYVEDESTLYFLSSHTESFAEFQSEYDRVLDYIPKDEYLKMSEDERNQLALDRYVQKWKGNAVGFEYERYCAYYFRQKGYIVEETGTFLKLSDLGRDLIIQVSESEIMIVQCKYWSQNKEIHEKHINQLYGTAVAYKLEKQNKNLKVRPVFVTNIALSETAKRFADYLKVEVLNLKLGAYPMIKCNINNGSKIYHLPFDQQYDRTLIKKDGEFYAWTVKEAVEHGFRRAMKHFFNN